MLLLLPCSLLSRAQHQSKVNATLSAEGDKMNVFQEITYHNTSNDYLEKIVLNDWNHAFSSKSSALAKRFSDEFVRSFYYASEKELGKTTVFSIRDRSDLPLAYHRPEKHIDLIEIDLKYPLAPGTKISFTIHYEIQIPSDKFTHFGYDNNGKTELKDWILFPARYENGDFLRYSNENLDDNPNALTDFEITLNGWHNAIITCNLNVKKLTEGSYFLSGENLNRVHLVTEKKSDFRS
ncbi:MAG: aminopeptidase, partial [Flavobacteriaceae bacterium]